MSSLFADTHNMVAILEKSDAAKGFEQIIDFLSGSYIYYALTVNLHIYISCIKQFWNTASVKRSDDVTRLQALVDRKKIMISKVFIYKILQLDDAEGVVCLPNEEIFAGLARWDTRSPPKGLLGMSLARRWLLQRVGKGFSGVETPLFEGMLAAKEIAEEEDVANDAIPSTPTPLILTSPPSHDIPLILNNNLHLFNNHKVHLKLHHKKLEIIKLKARVKKLERANKVKSSKLRCLRKVGASKRIESSDDMEDAEIYHLDLDHPSKVFSMQEDDLEVQEVVEVVTTTKLITDVVTAATSQVSAASATISITKPSIHAAAPTVVAAYTRRRKGMIIRDLEEELSSKTPAETPKLKDKGKGILIENPKPTKKKDQIELDAEYARKLHEEINKDHEEINKNIDWDATIDHVKQKSKNPQFDANMRFLFKSREEMEEEDQEVFKSINETPAQKAAKRRKLNKEAQKVEDLKKHLEVVDNEDDDVFTEATSLARKLPVVDY
uniref:Xylulose kinase-1 n=1 Tax=Tanacetum cinerariifolium TaxID=118510 RepID=A0A699I7V9_TANCI|nr:hypothetical protein [Tanacetum cinerariifolium]